jgi:cytochrome c-type biogenesis protein CcmH/NrfG
MDKFRIGWRLLSCVWLACAIAASAQTSFRTITVSTEPNSVIWLDDVRYGTADAAGRFTIKTVPPGTHRLRVRANGFKETTKPITAVQKGDITVTLVKTTDPAELAFQEGERLSTRDRQLSIAAYKKALALRPSYIDSHIAVARSYSDARDYENALKAIRDGKRAKPGVAELSAIEGRVYKETGDEAKAIAAFKRAITEGRGFQPEAYTGLGLLYKDRAEGETDDPGNAESDYREAAKYLSTAVKQLGGSPDGSVVLQLLGLVYEKQGKYREAIALYEDFLRTFPDSADAPTVQSFITQLRKQLADQP